MPPPCTAPRLTCHSLPTRQWRPWLTKKFIFGFAYAVVVTYGCLVAYYAAGYTSAADLMLWSVTYLQ